MPSVSNFNSNITSPGDTKPYAKPSDLQGSSVGQIFRLLSRNAIHSNPNAVGCYPTYGVYRRNKKTGEIEELLAVDGVMFEDTIAELHQVSTSELCNIYSLANENIPALDTSGRTDVAFRAAQRYAERKGYIAGFPNFETANGQNGIVVLNKTGADGLVHVDRRDYTPGQLGLGSNTNAYANTPWFAIMQVRNNIGGKTVNGERWDFAFPDFECSGQNNGTIVVSYGGMR